MKKQIGVLLGALFALCGADATAATTWGMRAGSSADLSGTPSTRTRENVNYKKYQTRSTTYETKDAGDLYYTKPQNRNMLYKQYEGANSSSARVTKKTVRKTRSETVINKMKRKYYLAHPFFQPLQGKFGSITDVSYLSSGYDITLPSGLLGLYEYNNGVFEELYFKDSQGSWGRSEVLIKEDFSYGITDRLALVVMARYNSTDDEYKWDSGTGDSVSDKGLNLYGAGFQWRFVDNEKWIATASAYYQHQKDISNNFLLDVKAGYKIAQSTIYGLARGWLLDFDGEVYGNGVIDKDIYNRGSAFIMAYGDNGKATFLEAGIGVFSVLNPDWTLNLEAVLGNYDWHTQANIKGAIGWQPNDWFTLNLYAKTVFYSDVDGKKLDTYFGTKGVYSEPDLSKELTYMKNVGQSELDNYSEYSVGVQAIFQF